MHDAQTLIDLLVTARAATQEIALFERPGSYRRITAAELRERALARLGDLQRAGLRAGDEVVMPVEDLGAFLDVFWACQLGGLVPMPLAAPSTDATCAKILDILGRRPAARLVVEPAGLARLTEARDAAVATGGDSVALAARHTWPAGEGAPGETVARQPDDIAFIQYSSGSTRAPKGVIVRQAQALANLEAIRRGSECGADDRAFSWMPLSHDMGLVGFHLTPLYAGADQVLLPTSAFARTPLVWIQDASALGATILSSPNFGYRHLLKALDRKGLPEGVDLSRVRLVLNGAEPISVELARAFMERLAPLGLAPTAMFPVYGLAEATLAVTFPALGDEIRGLRIARARTGLGDRVEVTESAASFVTCCCGAPLPGLEVRIAGEDGAALEDGHVGRLWIRGAGVTEGYHDDPEATAAAIQGEGWLDTGDLGFLQDGDLYVTGRRKDLVIVDGQNLYPHELEETLQAALDLDALRVAVAPVQRPGEAEQMAVFVLHRGEPADFAETAAAVRGELARTYGVRVELIVPVARIPRTTSGKVQRHLLANAVLDGEFDAALAAVAGAQQGAAADAAGVAGADDASPEALEALLMGYCEQVLGGERFGPTDNLFEQGLSSIDLAEIHGLVEARFPKGLDIRDFFDQPTVRALSVVLSERVRAGAAAATT